MACGDIPAVGRGLAAATSLSVSTTFQLGHKAQALGIAHRSAAALVGPVYPLVQKP